MLQESERRDGRNAIQAESGRPLVQRSSLGSRLFIQRRRREQADARRKVHCRNGQATSGMVSKKPTHTWTRKALNGKRSVV